MSTDTLHDSDFFAWTQRQADLLRQGRWAEADIEHLVEELENMGAGERRELSNRLVVLLTHLLKWQQQPSRRGNSWRLTIKTQRLDALDVLDENPSLRPQLPGILAKCYRRAVLKAASETGLDEAAFPALCPFTVEAILDEDFWPE